MSEGISRPVLVTLPEFAKALGVTYVVAKGMLEKPDAPKPAVAIGNRKAWYETDLFMFVEYRYRHVLRYLGAKLPDEAKELIAMAYDQGKRQGLEEARAEAQMNQG